MRSETCWAQTTFGAAYLGDARRTDRLVTMAARAAALPAGRITQVFRNAGERQGAYDFLEHDRIAPEDVSAPVFEATAVASRDLARVLVPIDGTSLSLVDDANRKGFGHVGTFASNGKGLKVVNALAVTEHGTPIGLADQVWWSRHARAAAGYRCAHERESKHWRGAIERIGARFELLAPTTKLHFLADREADASLLVRQLLDSQHEFTIRSNARRRVAVRGHRCELRRVLAQQRVLGTMRVELAATGTRVARTAVLDVRAATLPIIWRDKHRKNKRTVAPIAIVWARERTASKSRVEWFLYTNVAVGSARDACEVVQRYTMRWRVEDFHRSWKRGYCRVEDTQLRSANAVIKWATILAAVATRIERLRRLAREQPDAPATIELNADELEALVFLREQYVSAPSSRDELTIKKAVRWIADLGGFVGNGANASPGAVTIGRGLEQLTMAAAVIAKLRADGRLR